MRVLSVSAITLTSPDPSRLAAFYREQLGIPLQLSHHGPMREHWEGWLGEPTRGGVHVAILKGRGASPGAGGVAPSFRVNDIEAAAEALAREGTQQIHKIANLGDGKRLVSFRDPDGNIFRLFELAAA